jgi:lysozyme
LFIKTLEDHYKTDVIIYTGEAFYNDYLSNDFKDNYFWIARYGVVPPQCFQVGEIFSADNPCFKNAKKGCWQYSQYGQVKGIPSKVDLDFINNYYILKWVTK